MRKSSCNPPYQQTINLLQFEKVPRWYRQFVHKFWRGSREPTSSEADTLLRQGAGNGMPDFISWFKRKVLSNFYLVLSLKLLVNNELSCSNLQGQTDASMCPELRQVADGCAYKVRSFDGYDVNGFRFHTTSYERSRPNRKTTNTGVFTPGLDGIDYYGRIEEIYELLFHGCKPLNPVIFKCRWFDPKVVRKYPKLGLVEIQQSSVFPGDDVYIVAQQATQVYYVPYPCQKDALKPWHVVYKVSPHGKLPVPNDADYNIESSRNDGDEFFQEDGLDGRFEIDLTDTFVGMEVDNETAHDEDAGDDVDDEDDIRLLQKSNEDSVEDAADDVDDIDMRDSDEENYDPPNPDDEDAGYF